MAEGFNNDSVAVEGNDTKGSASIYYSLAKEKIRDVSDKSAFKLLLTLTSFYKNKTLFMIIYNNLYCTHSHSVFTAYICSAYF